MFSRRRTSTFSSGPGSLLASLTLHGLMFGAALPNMGEKPPHAEAPQQGWKQALSVEALSVEAPSGSGAPSVASDGPPSAAPAPSSAAPRGVPVRASADALEATRERERRARVPAPRARLGARQHDRVAQAIVRDTPLHEAPSDEAPDGAARPSGAPASSTDGAAAAADLPTATAPGAAAGAVTIAAPSSDPSFRIAPAGLGAAGGTGAPSRRLETPRGDERSALLVRYLTAVRDRIRRHREYPYLARRAQVQGTICLRVSLASSGHVLEVTPTCGQTALLLLKAALKAVADAAPFAPVPLTLGERLTFEVPVVFEIDDL